MSDNEEQLQHHRRCISSDKDTEGRNMSFESCRGMGRNMSFDTEGRVGFYNLRYSCCGPSGLKRSPICTL